MSYDFYAVTGPGDNDWIVPHSSDTHPAFDSDGAAGTVMLTEQGYARCGNYTSNVSWMWARCLTAVLGGHIEAWPLADRDHRQFNASGRTFTAKDDSGAWVGGQQYEIRDDRLCLRDLAGARMGDIAPLLASAVEWGVEHVDELAEGNPENGWGNAEGAVTYLWDIQRMCEQHPDATLGISS